MNKDEYEQQLEAFRQFAVVVNTWIENVIRDIMPVLTRLAEAMPKQKIVDRRRLSRRRARRRNERKEQE